MIDQTMQVPDQRQQAVPAAPPPGAGEPPADPQMAKDFNKVVQAGLKIMYAPETRKMLADGLTQQGSVADIMSQEIAGLMKIMDDKSGGKIPRGVVIPAAVALMQDLGDFIKEAGIAEPTDEDMKEALQKVVVLLVGAFHGDSETPGQDPEEGEQAEGEAPPQQAAGLVGGQMQ